MSVFNRMMACIAASASDPFVHLMLHLNGSNGGTTFTDSCKYAHAVSYGGNVNTSTAQKKFGTASAYFDGSGDYLYGSYSDLVIGTSDFTIDFWLYPTDVTTARGLVDTLVLGGSASTTAIVAYLGTTRAITINHNGVGILTTTQLCTANAWNHIAIVRASNTLKVYVNGVVGGSVSLTANLSSTGIVVGRFADTAGSFNYKGYLDELRISIGTARWTSDFTPPTAEYPI